MKKSQRKKFQLKKTKPRKKKQKSSKKLSYKKTLILSLSLVLIYSCLSKSFLFIPTKVLLLLGFNLANPFGLLTYSFIHISPMHLIGNLILLLSVGFIAEQKLSSKEYFGIYLIAGASAALVYGLLFPKNYLVGASAAISSLLAIAFVVDIKKTLVAIIIASISISLISAPVHSFTMIKYEQLQNKQSQAQEKIIQINSEIKKAVAQNQTSKAEQLNKTKQSQVKQFNETSTQALVINEGIKREEHAKTSPLVHLTGAFIGLGYLFLFRRKLIWEIPSQILPRNLLQKNSKKN